MAEQRSHNATLNAKGLDGAVTEEQARRMCASQGGHSLFIVDAHHAKLVIDEDGTQRIHLVADQVEYVPDEQADRVRTFMRALYLSRPDQFGQQAFDVAADGERSLDDAARDLDAGVGTDGAGNVVGLWDGNTEPPGQAVNADTGEVTEPGEALPPLPDSAYEEDAVDLPDGPVCGFPDCYLPEGHDGDHGVPEDTASDQPVPDLPAHLRDAAAAAGVTPEFSG